MKETNAFSIRFNSTYLQSHRWLVLLLNASELFSRPSETKYEYQNAKVKACSEALKKPSEYVSIHNYTLDVVLKPGHGCSIISWHLRRPV